MPTKYDTLMVECCICGKKLPASKSCWEVYAHYCPDCYAKEDPELKANEEFNIERGVAKK